MNLKKLAMALAFGTALAGPANAAYTVSIVEVTEADGTTIFLSGSGTLNVDGLQRFESIYASPALSDWRGTVSFGRSNSYTAYGSIVAPSIFSGTSRASRTDYSHWPTGQSIGVISYVSESLEAASGAILGSSILLVPDDYVSGSDLGLTTTAFLGTISDYGLKNGSYVYTWGSGMNADTLTINVGPTVSAVPEPATWAMMLVGFGLIGATARYRRRHSTVRYA